MDIKNFVTKNQYIANVARRRNYSISTYKKIYKNTPILFYKKEFFINFIKKNYPNYKISIINNPRYSLDQNYGFCVLISMKN